MFDFPINYVFESSYQLSVKNVHACVCARSLSPVCLFATPWTVAHQTPLSVGFSRQEDWSGLSFSPPRDLPNPGIKSTFSALTVGFSTTEPPGIQARKWKWSRSLVSDSATLWTIVHQAPQSMGFSRQEYWSGLPFPSPGDLPNPGIEPRSPAYAGRCFNLWATRETQGIQEEESKSGQEGAYLGRRLQIYSLKGSRGRAGAKVRKKSWVRHISCQWSKTVLRVRATGCLHSERAPCIQRKAKVGQHSGADALKEI